MNISEIADNPIMTPIQQAERVQIVDILLVNMIIFCRPIQAILFPADPGMPWFERAAGWFIQMGAAAGISLTLIIYLLQIPFSHWWMKRFKYGPTQWLWRSLTYLKPQPMKRQTTGWPQ